jgi:CubicO group peptidase (beta-lactamase class C family)
MSSLKLVAALGSVAFFANADPLGPGAGEWKLESPEEYGMSTAELDNAYRNLERSAGYRNCFLVIKDGALIYEGYSGPLAGRTWSSLGHSSTKTMGALLMGAYVTEGLVDIDADITETYGVPSPKEGGRLPGQGDGYGVTARDIMSSALGGSQEPGQEWEYDTVGSSWLNTLPLVANASGVEPQTMFEEKFAGPMGLQDNFGWNNVNSDWASGSVSSCVDLAKWGQLMLNKGDWPTGRIMSEDYMSALSTPQTNGDRSVHSNTCYGFMTWLSSNQDPAEYPGVCLNSAENRVSNGYFPPTARNDVFFAAGFGGQIAMAVPEHNTVLVTMGASLDFVRPSLNSVATQMHYAMSEEVSGW